MINENNALPANQPAITLEEFQQTPLDQLINRPRSTFSKAFLQALEQTLQKETKNLLTLLKLKWAQDDRYKNTSKLIAAANKKLIFLTCHSKKHLKRLTRYYQAFIHAQDKIALHELFTSLKTYAILLNETIFESFTLEEQKCCLNLAAQLDYKPLFVAILAANEQLTPDAKTMQTAGETIKRFLKYRPGRTHHTVYMNAKQTTHKLDILSLSKDFDDSDDEVSSDECENTFDLAFDDSNLLRDKIDKEKAIKKNFNRCRKLLTDETTENKNKYRNRQIKLQKNIYYLLYRGEHYRKDYYPNPEAVRDHYTSPDQYNWTVNDNLLIMTDLVRKVHYTETEDEKIRKTIQNEIKKQHTKPTAQYDKIKYHVSRKSDGKGDSKFISHTIDFKKALTYATGEKIQKDDSDNKRLSHYRQSTDSAKYKHAGFVNVYLVPHIKYKKQFKSINEGLLYEQAFKINHRRRNEQEHVSYLATLPEHHIYRLPIIYPKQARKPFFTKQEIARLHEKVRTLAYQHLHRTLKNTSAVILYPYPNETVHNTLEKLTETHRDEEGKLTFPVRGEYTDPNNHLSYAEESEPSQPTQSMELDEFIQFNNANEIFTYLDGLNYYSANFKLHGRLHHIRVSLWIKVLYNLYKHYTLLPQETLEDIILLYLDTVGLMHDLGRENDTTKQDSWEEASKNICQYFLIDTCGIEKETAIFYANAITLKARKNQRNRLPIHDLLHDADMLEVLRHCEFGKQKGCFFYENLFFYKRLNAIYGTTAAENITVELIENIVHFLEAQGEIHLTDTSNTITLYSGHSTYDASRTSEKKIQIQNSTSEALSKPYNNQDGYANMLKALEDYPYLKQCYDNTLTSPPPERIDNTSSPKKRKLDDKNKPDIKKSKTNPKNNNTQETAQTSNYDIRFFNSTPGPPQKKTQTTEPRSLTPNPPIGN